MKTFLTTLVVLLLAAACSAQVPNAPSFTLTNNFLGSPINGATSAIDVGAAYQFTTYSRLRADVWAIPAASSTEVLFGTDIDMWFACKLLSNTSLPCSKINPYFGAGFGFGRIAVTDSATVLRPAGVGRVGINYDPTGSGHFTINAIELNCGSLPVLYADASIRNATKCAYSTGISLGLGTSQTASAKKLAYKVEAEHKKMLRLQKQAEKLNKL